jgi:succinoglycan biosynthesis protein ExoO
MRFVFVTDELPRSGSSGHLALNHGIIEWLRRDGHQVTILLTRPRLNWPLERYSGAEVTGPAIKSWGNLVFTNSPAAAMTILARRILARLPARITAVLHRNARGRRYGMVDAVLGAFITPAQSAWCAACIQQIGPDAVLLDNIFRALLLHEPALQAINAIIGAPDLFYRRHQAMLAAGYKVYPPALPRELEAALLSTAKAIAAIQPAEAAEIGAMCPRQFVCITTPPALPCPPPPGQRKIPGRLVFIGSDTLPNIDGLRWFFADVWPRLQALQPGVTLDLVGDCGAAFGRLPSGVERLGRVNDHAAILHRAMLAIAPLRVSSGLKIKILDYARHGLATVMTPESLQGFAADATAPFIVAGDAAAFAGAIAARLAAPDAMDAQRALDYVARHYNAAVSFSGLAAALHMTASKREANFG